MTKKYLSKFRLHVDAGKVLPNAKLGSCLSSFGIHLGEFCKKASMLSSEYTGYKISILVIVKAINSYELKLGSPILSDILIKNFHDVSDTLLKSLILLKKKEFIRKTEIEIKKMILGTLKSFYNNKVKGV